MSEGVPPTAGEVVDRVARESYGRLVAYLAGVGGDVAAAEDALGDALVAALRTWPQRGVPDRPESWLVTAARRALVDAARRRAVAQRNLPELARLVDGDGDGAAPPRGLPDRRLDLMLVCTHPAIDPALHSPLMLQVVLGLDAERVGAAFLVPGPTMGQRLVRAKAKIRDARIPFTLPAPQALPERLRAVLDAVYAAYGTGWDDPASAPGDHHLVGEAIRLAEVLVEVLPDEPEARGLLAVLLHSHARAGARRDAAGRFVPLEEQDPRRWDPHLLARAETVLRSGGPVDDPGPYLLQAAIQSEHNRRAVTGRTDWDAVVGWYDLLVARTPTVGVCVARAAAYRRRDGATAALALLDELPADRVRAYQPYWVLRAHALRDLGRTDDLDRARRLAVALSADEAVRDHLRAVLTD